MATLSSCRRPSLIIRPTNLLLRPSLPNPSNLSFPQWQAFHVPRLLTPKWIPTTTITICHGKVFSEEISDVFFNDDEIVEDESDDDDEEEEETESSIDLLIKFLQSMFNKLSKRAKKASRSVLPSVIPPQLVSFAVDGTLLLGILSIARALLEVVCNLGSTVFTAILFLRVVWATISYVQPNGNTLNQGGSSFGMTQPGL